ncbi:OPT superfamily oligopeptide transporter [Linnemannia elongata AG-77]|uniref:OPT superfamily oligopeptide transporter n=1 Tax=Linnemannia elongata AG-77 TaxID=1314771 RepID=A0A197JCP0_9FUNG|nr:OPT superfamily oligopeptide transporter [Linnemannia elongata AG-77]
MADKQEFSAEKEFVDEKYDAERQSVVLEEEENSPIPEVAAIVSNKDDPTIPVMTFRYYLMAVLFSCILSFFNQFFWFRTHPMTISTLVIQLLSYPFGKFLARVLPAGRLNPGPFNIKEHVLVALTANCAGGVAYAVDITVIQKVWYNQDYGFLANLFLILTTQMLGYGMAGVLRRYLVYPAAMIWPANLVQVALFNTLHKEEDLQPGQWSRFKFFCVATLAMFFYQWIPGFLFPVISSIAWVCWIDPKNHILSTVGGARGLGVGAISLDWNNIVSFLGSPLIVPWWAQVNIAMGFFIIAWVMVPIAYFTNLWEAQRFPILTARLFTTEGDPYDANYVLENGTINMDKYNKQGPLRIATFFALTYGIGFAGLSSMITHTWLYHRHKLVAQWKQSRTQAEDIHHKLMQAYPEVPDWWYASLFVLMTAIALFTCEYYKYMPWWAVLLAILIAVVFALPVGLIQALTNQQPGLNIITEYVIGYILPGEPIPNVTFKTLGYISMAQAMLFTSDLKLGHYMKVPPRAMFWAQLIGTFIAGLVNLLTANWLLNSQDKICTEENKHFQCPSANTFFSASVIWGVIAPNLMFGPTSIYNAINYFFLIGFVLPIPFYYLKKAFPNTWMDFIHIPVLLAATGMMPPAQAYHYTNWLAVGFAFQFFARRYHPEWHLRFTYVMSAAFDSGVAFMVLASFFIFTIREKDMVQWWGNPAAPICRLDSYPLIAPKEGKVDPWAPDPSAEDAPMYVFPKPYYASPDARP